MSTSRMLASQIPMTVTVTSPDSGWIALEMLKLAMTRVSAPTLCKNSGSQ